MVQTREPVPVRAPGVPSPDAVALLGALARDVHTWASALNDARHRLLDAAHESPGAQRPAGAGEERVPVPRAEALLVGPYGARTWPWPAELGTTLLSALRAGCQVRVLSGPDPVRSPAARLAPDLDAAGARVRTLAAPLPPVLLIDGALAVVPRPGSDAAVLAIGDPTVVRLLHHFAEILWCDAVPAVRRDHPPVADQTALANRQLRRRILQLLAEGAKDETVARTLDISVRTCRRHIADILTRLGAVSRFQAGVQAVRLGLLAPEVPAGAGPWPATRRTPPLRSTGMTARRAS